MNDQPPPNVQSSASGEPVIRLNGKSFTIAEAASLAYSEQNSGHFQAAVAVYDEVLAKAPGFAEVHNNRGVCLQAMKRHSEALASFDNAIAVNPGYANAHNNRGSVLRAMRRLEDALASYDQTLAIKPDHVNALTNRGALLRTLNRYEDSLR